MPSATSIPKWEKPKFYAVARSPLLEKPTIFTSWARTHVVVTGISYQKAPHKSFKTLDKAREWMKARGVDNFEEVLQLENTCEGPKTGIGYYAVAHGRNRGITEKYWGPGGAEDEVHEYPGSCHQSFPTRRQAEEFIKDWKDQYLLATVLSLSREFDEGFRPALVEGGFLIPSLRTAEAAEQEDAKKEVVKQEVVKQGAKLETQFGGLRI